MIRLLPERIEATVEPLPETFTVLSYWVENRKAFYGGDIVMQLAQDMPEVRFLILGAREDEYSTLPNVTLLGWQDKLESFYNQSSVLIRLPEHDSLSAMVLEMLARGRYAIYNQKMSGCHFARDYAEAKAALEQIQSLCTPNHEGARSIRENFSVGAEAGKAAALCRQLLRESGTPATQARLRLITLGFWVLFLPVMLLFLVRAGISSGISRRGKASANKRPS